MTIYLVSKRGQKKLFAELKHLREDDQKNLLETIAPSKLDEILETAPDSSFFYLDAGAYTDEDLWETVRLALEFRPHRIGVFDVEGVVEDPAQVFFLGGVDYLSRSRMETPVSAERFSQVLRYLEDGTVEPSPNSAEKVTEADPGETAEAAPLIAEFEPPPHERLSGRDWSDVRTGGEYTFWFLYAQLEDTGRLAVRTSDEYASQIDDRFREQLLAEAGRFGGRVWMWKRYAGLLLFPYDGKRCMPIIPAVRLFMNRVLYTMERSTGRSVLTFRLAIHLGNTEYQEAGDTGEVVSEDVNFVYHLGARHTRPGELSITRSALSFVPPGLQQYFVESGSFEGHETYEMRRFVPGALDD